MIKRRLTVICASLLVILVAGCQSKFSMEDELVNKLPQRAKVIHRGARNSGPDSCYAFVISNADDSMVDEIVKEWNLKAADEPPSFFNFAKKSWWPSEAAKKAMSSKFEWVDETEERYRSLWFDESKKQLLLEYGCW